MHRHCEEFRNLEQPSFIGIHVRENTLNRTLTHVNLSALRPVRLKYGYREFGQLHELIIPCREPPNCGRTPRVAHACTCNHDSKQDSRDVSGSMVPRRSERWQASQSGFWIHIAMLAS